MNFTKMHGLGNDFIVIDCFREKIVNPSEFAKKNSNRHLGIGFDGLLMIEPSKTDDFRMQIFNADGTEAKMCGNGLRCAGKYFYDAGLTKKEFLTVETKAGRRKLELLITNKSVEQIRVDMGVPRLNAHSIPMLSDQNLVIQEPVEIKGIIYYITALSMGNPHAIVFVDDVDQIHLEKVGIWFEFCPRFPDRVNVEFCEVLDKNRIRIRVWERGVGETKACGTGACAAVVASVLNGLTENKVTVKLLGGELFIKWEKHDNHVYMTGTAERVFTGVI